VVQRAQEGSGHSGSGEEGVAGRSREATLAKHRTGMRGLPDPLDKDQVSANDSFVATRNKFARRWLASKGVIALEEDKNPVNGEIEGFFDSVRNGTRPKADLEVGLADSIAVILSNLAMMRAGGFTSTRSTRWGAGGAPKKKA